jgi:hypothetical protein
MSGSQNDPVTIYNSDDDVVPTTENATSTPSRRAKGTQDSPVVISDSSRKKADIIQTRGNGERFVSGRALRNYVLESDAQRLRGNYSDEQIEAIKKNKWSDREIVFHSPWNDSWVHVHPRTHAKILTDLDSMITAATGSEQTGDDRVCLILLY